MLGLLQTVAHYEYIDYNPLRIEFIKLCQPIQDDLDGSLLQLATDDKLVQDEVRLRAAVCGEMHTERNARHTL